MMRSLALGLPLAALFAFPVPGHAQDERPGLRTVEDMLEACERALNGTEGNAQELADAAFCDGVLYGAGQAARTTCEAGAWTLLSSFPVVSANPPSPRSVLQAWINWARDNPAEWGLDFGNSAVLVLVQEFPCEN